MGRLSFPPYSIPDDADLLFRDDEVVALEPTPVRVLRYLAANHGRVVTKQELLDHVWPDAFTTDSVLKRAINLIRRALDDDPKRARFVETHHRRGYRFLAPVEVTAAEPQTNLPNLLTRFVGREALVADVARAIAASRLVTLVGLGGIGKTRLAVAAAEAAAPGFAGGVWFADLAAVAEPRDVAGAVAAALGARDEAGDPLAAATRLLARTSTLLVLDNCEHVLDAAAAAATALLTAARGLHVLATSREPLALSGEVVREVPPLALPDEACDSAEQLAGAESARLLLDRIALTDPAFAATDATARLAARVCRKLEGIPLAIELAAARAGAFTLEELDARLDEPLGFLAGARRGTPARQQTLRAALAWSCDMLAPEERALFARLSVFAGGFTRGAAARAFHDVAGVEDALERLVEKSLVQASRSDRRRRFRLLEIVRRFAAARLDESGDAAAARARHAAWALDAARDIAAGFDARRDDALVEFDAERENFRAALGWYAGEGSDAVSGLRLACALWPLWDARGRWAECRAVFEHALAAGAGVPAELEAEALRLAGLMARRLGDYATACEELRASLAISRTLGDDARTSRTVQNLAGTLLRLGDHAAASALYGEALELARRAGSDAEIASVLAGLGHVAADAGDYASADAYFEQALALSHTEARRVARAILLRNMAEIARRRGDLARAGVLAAEALDRARELGHRTAVVHSCDALGSVLVEAGDLPRAAALLREAIEGDLEVGDRPHLAYVLEAFVGLASALGEHRQALRLAGAAEALRERLGSPLPEGDRATLDRFAGASRAALGAEADAESALGRATEADEAIALARALARKAELRTPTGWRRKAANRKP